MLSFEEIEDLVCIYLQSQGWYVIPNSRKANTLAFEYDLTKSDSGDKARVQVKAGDTKLNIEEYAVKYDHRVFLFQANERYTGLPAKNVEAIKRKGSS